MTRAATTEANLQRTVDELRRELGARTAELAEARAQQSATADVLKVISRSAFDLQTVLETLIRSAVELSGAVRGTIYLRDGDLFRFRAASYEDINPTWLAFLKDNPQRAGRHSTAARAIASGQTVCIPDLLADPEIEIPANALAGTRAVLATPLLRDAKVEGVMVLSRPTAGPFTQRQIELVETFADQAVIAIENARLFDEVQQRTRDLSESLQQQTATADVLKVISRSAFDLQTVLNTLTESAAQLCNADMGSIARKDETGYYHATNYNFAVDWVRLTDTTRLQPGRGSLIGRVLLAEKAVQIIDVLDDAEYGYRDMQQAAGYRTLLGVPLVRQGEAIGVLFLGRKTVEQFTDKQIELLSTFADQAVIAIENARLFDEVQARTRDVEEALRYQTGSATILNVIASSPTDVQPVLNAIVESACELCGAYDANVLLRYGDELHFSAHHGPIPTGTSARPISREWVTGRSVVDKVPVQVSDFDGPEAADFPEGRRQSREQGHRCTLSVPLLREDEAIGAIALRRLEPVAFNEKQIALLQTFADQAVIALGNVRLFEEVQAKTRDLTEALTYQTGSANILNVIASSPTDVQPVLKAIVQSACEVCEAYDAAVVLQDGDDLRFSAHHGPIPIGLEKWPINRRWTAGRAFLDRKPVHIEDLRDAKHADFSDGREMSVRMGHRSILSVPLLREGESIGAIVLRRTRSIPSATSRSRCCRPSPTRP